MKKLLLLIALCLFFGVTRGQNINPDSLVKLAIAVKGGITGRPQNPDSLLKKMFLIKSPAGRIKVVYDIIISPDNEEMSPVQLLNYEHKILDLAKKNNDPILEAVITGELGYNIYYNGDAPIGLKMLVDALKLAEKTGNKQAIGTVYNNLAVCSDNVDLEISYLKKALQFSTESGDELSACAELNNFSACYLKKNEKDLARSFLLKSLGLAIDKRIGFMIPECVTRFGWIQTDNDLRLKYIRYALMMPQSQRDTVIKGQILLRMAYVYQDEHKMDSALLYAKDSYRFLSGKLLVRTLNPAQLLAKLYIGKNADSALKYTNIYYTIRDSIFSTRKMERTQSMAFAEQQRQQEIAAQKVAYQTTIRLYLLAVVILFLMILAFVFWRNNRHKQKANHLLSEQKGEIETQRDNLGRALEELKNTQTQLVQSEKMASLGELTAGIAHEIQNPLNFVNNFSEVSAELMAEMNEQLENGDLEEAKGIASDVVQNLEKIQHHGKRADAIVKGMLEHSRASTGQKELTNLNALAGEYLRLSYHGLRAKDKSFKAELITNFDDRLPKVNVIPQDIGRVLLNLFNNAFYAVNHKSKSAGADYEPEVTVNTSSADGQVIIKVKDNGIGIPDTIKEKIMQPFFTTKPTGEGTGLGLSLSYDIVVKGHGGTIQVDSKEGEGSEFVIKLPVR